MQLKFIVAILCIVCLLSCTKSANDKNKENYDSKTNNVFSNEYIDTNIIKDIDQDIIDEISKKVANMNFIYELPNIFAAWETGNYVELPDCPKADTKVLIEIYDMFLNDAPLTFQTYPMIIKFMEQMIEVGEPQMKVSATALMGLASEQLYYYEDAIKYYVNTTNFVIPEDFVNYDGMKEFKITCLISAASLYASLYNEEEVLKFEKIILDDNDENQISNYYMYLSTMYILSHQFEKIDEMIKDGKIEQSEQLQRRIRTQKALPPPTKNESFYDDQREELERSGTILRIFG